MLAVQSFPDERAREGSHVYAVYAWDRDWYNITIRMFSNLEKATAIFKEWCENHDRNLQYTHYRNCEYHDSDEETEGRCNGPIKLIPARDEVYTPPFENKGILIDQMIQDKGEYCIALMDIEIE